MSIKGATEESGVSYTAAHYWKKAHARHGDKALRKVGGRLSLNARQEARLKRLVIDKTPDQLKLPFMLGERRAAQDLIFKEFNKALF